MPLTEPQIFTILVLALVPAFMAAMLGAALAKS